MGYPRRKAEVATGSTSLNSGNCRKAKVTTTLSAELLGFYVAELHTCEQEERRGCVCVCAAESTGGQGVLIELHAL